MHRTVIPEVWILFLPISQNKAFYISVKMPAPLQLCGRPVFPHPEGRRHGTLDSNPAMTYSKRSHKDPVNAYGTQTPVYILRFYLLTFCLTYYKLFLNSSREEH